MLEPFNMDYERETNMIDREGNFLFENKRVEITSDAWMESLEQEAELRNEGSVAYIDVEGIL